MVRFFWLVALLCLPVTLWGAEISLPGTQISLSTPADGEADYSNAIKILLLFTVLSLAPAILVVMTSFTRIIIVLAMLRHALGMQQTPPNTVLISLALFLTLFSMTPVINQINTDAYEPYSRGELTFQEAVGSGFEPLKSFMLRQTREEDLRLMIELSGEDMPRRAEDVKATMLLPAFLISELMAAFQIGFIIFIPFLLVDIVAASVLMSMGMLMVPPMMISLPIKILMFVLIDGWSLVIRSLIGSFH